MGRSTRRILKVTIQMSFHALLVGKHTVERILSKRAIECDAPLPLTTQEIKQPVWRAL